MCKNWKMELVNAGKESVYGTSTRYTISLKIKDVIKMSSMALDAIDYVTYKSKQALKRALFTKCK